MALRMRMLESRSWLRIGGVLEYAVKIAYGLDNKIQNAIYWFSLAATLFYY